MDKWTLAFVVHMHILFIAQTPAIKRDPTEIKEKGSDHSRMI